MNFPVFHGQIINYSAKIIILPSLGDIFPTSPSCLAIVHFRFFTEIPRYPTVSHGGRRWIAERSQRDRREIADGLQGDRREISEGSLSDRVKNDAAPPSITQEIQTTNDEQRY